MAESCPTIVITVIVTIKSQQKADEKLPKYLFRVLGRGLRKEILWKYEKYSQELVWVQPDYLGSEVPVKSPQERVTFTEHGHRQRDEAALSSWAVSHPSELSTGEPTRGQMAGPPDATVLSPHTERMGPHPTAKVRKWDSHAPNCSKHDHYKFSSHTQIKWAPGCPLPLKTIFPSFWVATEHLRCCGQ